MKMESSPQRSRLFLSRKETQDLKLLQTFARLSKSIWKVLPRMKNRLLQASPKRLSRLPCNTPEPRHALFQHRRTGRRSSALHSATLIPHRPGRCAATDRAVEILRSARPSPNWQNLGAAGADGTAQSLRTLSLLVRQHRRRAGISRQRRRRAAHRGHATGDRRRSVSG